MRNFFKTYVWGLFGSIWVMKYSLLLSSKFFAVFVKIVSIEIWHDGQKYTILYRNYYCSTCNVRYTQFVKKELSS